MSDVKGILNTILGEPEKQYIRDLTERLVNHPDVANFNFSFTDAAALKAIIPFFNGLLDGVVEQSRPGIMCNTFNMNAKCEVVLTDYGVRILATKSPEMYLNNFKVKTRVLKTMLWHLFEIYGEHMVHGMPEVPFVDNEITIATE